MQVARLRASGVSLRYGKQEILRGLEFAATGGRVIGVLGPSGAGKSSLFKVLVGDEQLSSGSVHLDGVDVTELPLWKRARLGMSYLPQEPSVLFGCTVRQNITTFERALGSRKRAGRRDWLAEFGLEGQAATPVDDLSGGERRRVELIRTLLPEASTYLLDEPFAGLDPSRVERIGAIVRGEAARGALVLLSDHRIGDVMSLCDEAWLLVDGRISLQTDPATFVDHPVVRARYLQ